MDQHAQQQDPRMLAEALKKQRTDFGIPEDQNHFYNPDASGMIGGIVYDKYYKQYAESEMANGRQPLPKDQWAKIMSAQQHNQMYTPPAPQEPQY